MTFRDKSMRYFIRLLLVIAAAALLAMMSIVVGNVIGRLFFRQPVLGTVELAGLTGVILIAVAIVFAEREHRNVIVDILASRFPPRPRAIADSFTLFLSFIAVAFLSWAIFDSAFEAAITGQYTETLGIKTGPFEFAWAIGNLFLCLFLLQHVIQAIIKGVKK